MKMALSMQREGMLKLYKSLGSSPTFCNDSSVLRPESMYHKKQKNTEGHLKSWMQHTIFVNITVCSTCIEGCIKLISFGESMVKWIVSTIHVNWLPASLASYCLFFTGSLRISQASCSLRYNWVAFFNSSSFAVWQILSGEYCK